MTLVPSLTPGLLTQVLHLCDTDCPLPTSRLPLPSTYPPQSSRCSLAPLFSSCVAQVLHLFDTDCALPISQLRLGDLFRWWPRLKELHIQGHLEFSDMGRVLRNNTCLTVLDLYHMHSDMPFTVGGASVEGCGQCVKMCEDMCGER